MRVVEIWRYPVKSLRGEQLETAEVGLSGFAGDRIRAVVDSESGVSLSAKRHGELLLCRSWTEGNEVLVGLPDGSEFPVDSPQTAAHLSSLLDRRVEVRAAAGDSRVHHEYTTDTATGGGDAMVVEASAIDAFFDGAPVHLLTTATLRELSRHEPGSSFVGARFRPNLLVDVDEDGFVEGGWVDNDMQIGEVPLHVVGHKTRCVMTTRAQGDLPKDVAVFKTVNRVNERRAGIELEPNGKGLIHIGDPVAVTQ